MCKHFLKAAALVVVTLVSGAPSAKANVIFFGGNLRTDANVIDCGPSCTLNAGNSDGNYAQWAAVVDTFSVATPSSMTAITYGYGGGVSSAGPIAPGGLEPYLSLFDAGGNFVASTFFGTLCPAGAQTYAGQCFDVLLNGGVLAPGAYQLALTAFDNMSLAENPGGAILSDGFSGLGNLNGTENLNYAFDVTLTSTSPTPEPGSFISIGLGLALCALSKFRGSNKTGGSK